MRTPEEDRAVNTDLREFDALTLRLMRLGVSGAHLRARIVATDPGEVFGDDGMETTGRSITGDLAMLGAVLAIVALLMVVTFLIAAVIS